jgi:hypothetical protein
MPKELAIIDAPFHGSGRNQKSPFPDGGKGFKVFAIVCCLCQIFFDYLFNLSFRLNPHQLLYNLAIFDE